MVFVTLLSTKEQYKQDALDVALNIGLLTKDDKLKFTSTKLGLRGERSLDKNVQRFKLFDTKSKQVIFSLIIHTDSPIKIIEFKRGIWERLLTEYVKSQKSIKQSSLKLRVRIKK